MANPVGSQVGASQMNIPEQAVSGIVTYVKVSQNPLMVVP
jgi:hypothetical protein